MHRWLMTLLACPECSVSLEVQGDWQGDTLSEGMLRCPSCSSAWPVRRGIPRFVPERENYCGSFGLQWQTFRRTQIDEFNGWNVSRQRFERETGWDAARLREQLILDGGCGAGRFASVALSLGARVVAVDMSHAVDACRDNLEELGHDESRFGIIQASIYRMPFLPGTFDAVYSIGVVQHTPDRQKTVKSLAAVLRPGGMLALWVYERSWRSWLGYKYWMRIVSRRLSLQANWRISNLLISCFFPVGWVLNKIPTLGPLAVRFLPLAFRCPLGSDWRRARDWSLLDTFDNLSPAYDNPMTEGELKAWLHTAGLPCTERGPAPGLAVSACCIPPAPSLGDV